MLQHMFCSLASLRCWRLLTSRRTLGAREKIEIKATHDKFARVGEQQQKREAALDRRLRREADMQAFQRDPIDGQHFGFQGYFLWPSDGLRPEELLGANSEAFDPIRTYNPSHIIFEPQISCFKILSNKENAMQNAIERIEGTIREYAARSSTTYAFNLVQPLEALSMRADVKTLPGPSPNSSGNPGLIPVLTGRSPAGDEITAYQTVVEEIQASNQRKIRNSLRKILQRLPHFRGRLRMRVHFGTFVLDTIRWPGGTPTIPFTDFLASVTNIATTTGNVLRDLQCQGNAEVIITRCTSSNASFEPAMKTDQGAFITSPVFTGRFRFRTPASGDVSLEVEMRQRQSEGVFEISRTQWTRNSQMEASSPLDVNVVQLTGGCSWRFNISHSTTVDDNHITTRMADFANSVWYKAPPNGVRPEIAGCKVFKHAFNMQYEIFEQKIALQYVYKEQREYIFELARYDTFSPNVNTASSKTQWGASFWNNDWDKTFEENENLGIGQAATWDPKIDRFFAGKEGFQTFLDNVHAIKTMLDQTRDIPSPGMALI